MNIKTGVIIALSSNGHGYIKQDDGSVNLYFHAKDITNGSFDYLRVGEIVQYIEREGARGYMAKSIVIIKRQDKYKKITYI